MKGIDGVILAGGRSSRMRDCDKAHCLIDDRSMIDWVLRAAKPQVNRLAINSNQPPEAFAPFHLTVIPDRVGGFQGPLMGLYSAMMWFATHEPQDWLAVFPCDMPFMPGNLVATLQQAAEATGNSVMLASVKGELQPTTSVWHMSLLPELRVAVQKAHMKGITEFLSERKFGHIEIDSALSHHFFHVKNPEDLEFAQQLAREQFL